MPSLRYRAGHREHPTAHSWQHPARAEAGQDEPFCSPLPPGSRDRSSLRPCVNPAAGPAPRLLWGGGGSLLWPPTSSPGSLQLSGRESPLNVIQAEGPPFFVYLDSGVGLCSSKMLAGELGRHLGLCPSWVPPPPFGWPHSQWLCAETAPR